jgi:hypothetical protein
LLLGEGEGDLTVVLELDGVAIDLHKLVLLGERRPPGVIAAEFVVEGVVFLLLLRDVLVEI